MVESTHYVGSTQEIEDAHKRLDELNISKGPLAVRILAAIKLLHHSNTVAGKSPWREEFKPQ